MFERITSPKIGIFLTKLILKIILLIFDIV